MHDRARRLPTLQFDNAKAEQCRDPMARLSRRTLVLPRRIVETPGLMQPARPGQWVDIATGHDGPGAYR
jgi:hypothetical protein